MPTSMPPSSTLLFYYRHYQVNTITGITFTLLFSPYRPVIVRCADASCLLMRCLPPATEAVRRTCRATWLPQIQRHAPKDDAAAARRDAPCRQTCLFCAAEDAATYYPPIIINNVTFPDITSLIHHAHHANSHVVSVF